ncbi:cysteine protease [Candidatus Scalindua japonica]|uniref:Cysteine protease n=2 Tax=Candidatus Scalindua japonica TaxID=1284222 RepID=A0A286TTX1_9BACT|nr:cysteine protease [Candidatus Scalindua japonica]
MLYEMARRFDEWPGEEYFGSSCRGAIRGWYNMGVCTEEMWPYRTNDKSTLSINMAKDARSNTIGAYYRLRHDIVDFHAALNEVEVLYVSATVHSGWWKDSIRNGIIPFRDRSAGGHAFAIVGYNEKGFWVQNSWNIDWGNNGIALWTYEDWQVNIRDAWVVRLALPTPQIFGKTPDIFSSGAEGTAELKKGPVRAEIAGHFVHIDDGKFYDNGRYWSNQADVTATAEHLADSGKYRHLLFYAHGGLNSSRDSARRISAVKEVFKANGIYPYHFMYDTGMLEEIKDIISGKKRRATDRVAGVGDWSDKFIELLTRKPGRAIWREMKDDAKIPFYNNRAGIKTISIFINCLLNANKLSKQIHIIGHSTGGILLAHFIEAFKKIAPKQKITTCSLMAPACTVDLFNAHYKPYLGSKTGKFGIDKMTIYNLTDELEVADNVAEIYRKSLLYLVSNAFEEEREAKILGMQRYSVELKNISSKNLDLVYSNGAKQTSKLRSASRSHGGFDNDKYTMNDILGTILGKKPARPFKDVDLKY